MGVVTDASSVGVVVDYSMPTDEIYITVAVHSLLVQKTLLPLSCAGMSSALGHSKLPSWVPDWSQDNGLKLTIGIGRRFNAAGDSRPILSASADRKILTIRGVVVDIISQVNMVKADEEDISNNSTIEDANQRQRIEMKRLLESCDDLARAAHKFPEGQTRDNGLWRTLCCDLTMEIPLRRAPEEYATGCKVLRRIDDATREDGKVCFTEDR